MSISLCNLCNPRTHLSYLIDPSLGASAMGCPTLEFGSETFGLQALSQALTGRAYTA